MVVWYWLNLDFNRDEFNRSSMYCMNMYKNMGKIQLFDLYIGQPALTVFTPSLHPSLFLVNAPFLFVSYMKSLNIFFSVLQIFFAGGGQQQQQQQCHSLQTWYRSRDIIPMHFFAISVIYCAHIVRNRQYYKYRHIDCCTLVCFYCCFCCCKCNFCVISSLAVANLFFTPIMLSIIGIAQSIDVVCFFRSSLNFCTQ